MALCMAEDKMTTYAYGESFAAELAFRVRGYGKLLRAWLDKICYNTKNIA